jgi:hypothetical protein
MVTSDAMEEVEAYKRRTLLDHARIGTPLLTSAAVKSVAATVARLWRPHPLNWTLHVSTPWGAFIGRYRSAHARSAGQQEQPGTHGYPSAEARHAAAATLPLHLPPPPRCPRICCPAPGPPNLKLTPRPPSKLCDVRPGRRSS